MLVDVKLNNLIWALTGRSDGFICPLMNTFVSVPFVGDSRIDYARKFLRLDTKGTDFYVYGALAGIYSSLYFVRSLEVEHQAAYVPGIITSTWSGADVYERLDGEIVYSGNNPVVLANSNAWIFLPYYDTTTLSVSSRAFNWDEPFDALKLELDAGPGSALTITKYWLGTAGTSKVFDAPQITGNIISVNAMEFAGLKARFDVTSGDDSWLNTPPALYPYRLIRQRIADDSALISLMLEAGTVGAFHETSNDMVAVGALAAAIVRQVMSVASSVSYDTTETITDDPTIPAEMELPVTFVGVKPGTECNE